MSSDYYQQYILPHAHIIVKICRAYTNTQEEYEDYYQEVCLQIWKSRDSFSGQAQWSTWIYRLTLNVCLTLLNKYKSNKDHHARNTVPPVVHVENQAFKDESLNMLYGAIKQLSEIDRAVILLYLEEKSYREIADIIETSESNIT